MKLSDGRKTMLSSPLVEYDSLGQLAKNSNNSSQSDFKKLKSYSQISNSISQKNQRSVLNDFESYSSGKKASGSLLHLI